MPVGAPSASGGSSLMKSCQPCVGIPNPTAVYALSCATCTLSSAAPSMRLNAFSTPPSSTTAITIGVPISVALASAAAIIWWAASVLMLAFGNVWAIGLSSARLRKRRAYLRRRAGRRKSAADHAEHLVAPALHVLLGHERLERQAQQGLGVRRAHVEVPVVVVHGRAVEVRDPAVGEALLELRHLRRAVLDLGVDLARDEVLGAQRLEQLAHLLALDRELLEDEERRDRARAGVVEVVEVVVAGDLAAEDRALVAHARLEEGVADAVGVGGAAGGAHDVRDRARRAHVVEDRRAGLLGQQVLGEDRGEEVAVDEAPGVVDEEAAVGVAVLGDAEVGAGLAHLVDDEAAVLLEHRVGLVVGELAVRLPVELDEVERKLVD